MSLLERPITQTSEVLPAQSDSGTLEGIIAMMERTVPDTLDRPTDPYSRDVMAKTRVAREFVSLLGIDNPTALDVARVSDGLDVVGYPVDADDAVFTLGLLQHLLEARDQEALAEHVDPQAWAAACSEVFLRPSLVENQAAVA